MGFNRICLSFVSLNLGFELGERFDGLLMRIEMYLRGLWVRYACVVERSRQLL